MAKAPVTLRDGRGQAVVLPWLDALFERLVEARFAQTLAHALLLSGPAGVGKDALAHALADAWLCEAEGVQASERPCGRCRGCGLTAVGNHPDLHRLVPAEGKATISVDQIRELSAELALKPHAGGSRVALITPAEGMTVSAQNSLLKTLEEPPSGAVLVLITHQLDALAPTIRSRCQQLSVAGPDPAQAQAWLADQGVEPTASAEALQLARQSPLAALQLVEDGFAEQASSLAEALGQIALGRAEPINVAGGWEKLDMQRILAWWQGALHAIAREGLASGAQGAEEGPETATSYRVLAAQGARWVAPSDLFEFADRLAEATLTLRGQANPRLLLEGLLIDWARVTRPARTRRKPT
ncbi:MAG: DNA polymerase III subunit delta' [Pseudomonadota bacterium]